MCCVSDRGPQIWPDLPIHSHLPDDPAEQICSEIQIWLLLTEKIQKKHHRYQIATKSRNPNRYSTFEILTVGQSSSEGIEMYSRKSRRSKSDVMMIAVMVKLSLRSFILARNVVVFSDPFRLAQQVGGEGSRVQIWLSEQRPACHLTQMRSKPDYAKKRQRRRRRGKLVCDIYNAPLLGAVHIFLVGFSRSKS